MKKQFPTPEDLYGPLFYDVHKERIFEDGKTFADARALLLPSIIIKKYEEAKVKKDFNLTLFVKQYFELPNNEQDNWDPDAALSLEKHLAALWSRLERPKDKPSKRSSKISLPYPYVVPGGRFNEIYYWDSYFTMLGLIESDRLDIVENMVQNFHFLINTFGHIPNGNRTYFLSRSQPPFYSLMVKLLIHHKGPKVISTYMSSLIKEYNFWMNGIDKLEKERVPKNRIVKVNGSFLLNRYYDHKDTPREEMYGDDWEMIAFSESKSNPLFRNLRAACESGWDFSSRWLSDIEDLKTIRTIELLPIDLNCLLWHMEQLISECYDHLEKGELSLQYGIIANQRKKAIQTLFWDEEKQFFFDYDVKDESTTDRLSLGGVFPLFLGIATKEQARACAKKLESKFLHPGGLVTTPYTSGQQWDAPNGWAPLQWIAIKGLMNYEFNGLAREIALRWTTLNEKVFKQTGKMLEKYNVVDTNLEGGGGEYPVQDGFGWTNGVYLAIKNA